jgi:hypothetical protein
MWSAAVDVPLFAARAAGRLRRMPELGRSLLEALSGTSGAEFGISPLLLGRLLL